MSVDGSLPQTDVRDYMAELEASWNAKTPEEQEAIRAKNIAESEERKRKNAGKTLDQIMGEAMAESLGKPDWKYVDLPKLTKDRFNQFVDTAGQGNLQWITLANYTGWGPDKLNLIRGQVLISPQGIINLGEMLVL